MSERGVRRFASGCVCRTEQVKQDYLFADPDVVAVLRKVRQEEARCTETVETMGGVGVALAAANQGAAYCALAGWIAETFHVRLTETGWEWTEQVGV